MVRYGKEFQRICFYINNLIRINENHKFLEILQKMFIRNETCVRDYFKVMSQQIYSVERQLTDYENSI